jgi:hypothetical protein
VRQISAKNCAAPFIFLGNCNLMFKDDGVTLTIASFACREKKGREETGGLPLHECARN